VRSRPEGLRLGRRELFVCQRARVVQLCEVFDLVGRVRWGRRILRLLLAIVGRLVLGRLLIVGLLLLVSPAAVVSNCPSSYRPRNERPASGPSPESHGKTPSRRRLEYVSDQTSTVPRVVGTVLTPEG
jgi:hypothetical protein